MGMPETWTTLREADAQSVQGRGLVPSGRANKNYGFGYETDVVGYLRGRDQVASRIARTVPDEGDVVLGDAEFILQLKANRDANTSASLGSRLEAARGQAAQYARARGDDNIPTAALVIKNPRKSIGKSFIVLYLEDFIDDGPGE
jgi:hypothetical protein